VRKDFSRERTRLAFSLRQCARTLHEKGRVLHSFTLVYTTTQLPVVTEPSVETSSTVIPVFRHCGIGLQSSPTRPNTADRHARSLQPSEASFSILVISLQCVYSVSFTHSLPLSALRSRTLPIRSSLQPTARTPSLGSPSALHGLLRVRAPSPFPCDSGRPVASHPLPK